MRVARRTFLASTIASVAAPAVMRVAWADAPQFSLKLHHAFSAVSSAHDKFLAPWARQIEAQSGGRIRIDLFPSMQLGGAPADLFDQARDGVVDIAWAQPSNTPGRFPRIEAFELPFVPSSRALVSSKAVEDYARANLTDEFREVHPICFSCSDRGVLHTNRPVHTVEEIRDLRLHVQTKFAVEAVHFDAAIVGHHFPEAQMGERGEMQEFADRQLDADLVIPRRHPQLAGVIPLAPAGGADGIAKNPEPGVVAMNVLFAAAAWGEGFYCFDRLGDVLGGLLARELIVGTDAADDFARRLLHPGKPALQEV